MAIYWEYHEDHDIIPKATAVPLGAIPSYPQLPPWQLDATGPSWSRVDQWNNPCPFLLL
jgi:hypothetical protein